MSTENRTSRMTELVDTVFGFGTTETQARKVDALYRAHLHYAAARRIQAHTSNHALDRGEPGHFPAAEMAAWDAAMAQEDSAR